MPQLAQQRQFDDLIDQLASELAMQPIAAPEEETASPANEPMPPPAATGAPVGPPGTPVAKAPFPIVPVTAIAAGCVSILAVAAMLIVPRSSPTQLAEAVTDPVEATRTAVEAEQARRAELLAQSAVVPVPVAVPTGPQTAESLTPEAGAPATEDSPVTGKDETSKRARTKAKRTKRTKKAESRTRKDPPKPRDSFEDL